MMTRSRPTRRLALLVASATLAGGVATGAAADTPRTAAVTNSAGTTFLVVGHRGGAGEWPENSLEAFQGSAEAGYDGIETDLRFTSDHQPVLMHEDVLPSRCSSAGRKVHQLTLAQLSRVRCADLAGHLVVPIPTFGELAEVLRAHPSIALDLEFKGYTGQSVASQRASARRGMALLEQYGLLARTRVISFWWPAMLPEIRKASPSIDVWALDKGALDLHRVRLAARLGATRFGITTAESSAYLARYIRSKGMDFTPWKVEDAEQTAFAVHYAGATYTFLTDTPGQVRADLATHLIDIDPVAVATTTTLSKAVTVSSTTYRAGVRHHPRVLGTAVPRRAGMFLDSVSLSITVTGGSGRGSLVVGARSGALERVSLALPKGTATLRLTAPVGDAGEIEVSTSQTVRLKVKVVGYTRLRFTPA